MNSLRIRVRGPKGILTVGDLYQETTWRDLQEKLREASGIAVEKMQGTLQHLLFLSRSECLNRLINLYKHESEYLFMCKR